MRQTVREVAFKCVTATATKDVSISRACILLPPIVECSSFHYHRTEAAHLQPSSYKELSLYYSVLSFQCVARYVHICKFFVCTRNETPSVIPAGDLITS